MKLSSNALALLRGACAALAASTLTLLAGCGGGGGAGNAAPPQSSAPAPTPTNYAVGGAVVGLATGESVQLQNGTSKVTVGANGTFAFTEKQATGSLYAVTIAQPPDGKICQLSQATGTVSSADVTTVAVDCTREVNWITNGTVFTTALSADGKVLYIGGDFTRVGKRTGSFAPLDATSGVVKAHAVVNGQVHAQIQDGNGGWYIGGKFTSVGGVERKFLARLKADGSLDTTFAPEAQATVYALALSGGTLFVGGEYGVVKGAAPSYVAALDANSGLVKNLTVGVNGAVRQLATAGSVLYLQGNFTLLNGESRQFLGAVDIATGVTKPWNPNPGNGNSSPNLRALRVVGSTILVAGEFTHIGGAERNAIAAVDGVSGVATSWNVNLTSSSGVASVIDMFVDGGTLYIGGQFTAVASKPRTSVAAVYLATAAPLDWAPALGQSPLVTAVAANADTVFISGEFSTANTSTLTRLAALDKVSAAPRAWADSDRATVNLLTAVGNTVWAGGKMDLLSGQTRQHIAAISTESGLPTTWDPSAANSMGSPMGGRIVALVPNGASVIAAGLFERIGGAARSGLAALDVSTGKALPWNPALSGRPSAIALYGNTLYAGGQSLTSVDGQPRAGLAAFDVSTWLLKSWAPDASAATVNAIIATATHVYVAGQFSAIGGQPRAGVAALDPNTGTVKAWNAKLGGGAATAPAVISMTLLNESLYIAGDFGNLDGLARAGLAAVDANSGAVRSWTPAMYPGVPAQALAAANDTVYVTLTGGEAQPPGLAMMSLNASTGALAPFKLTVTGSINAISLTDKGMYVSGTFNDLEKTYQPNLAFTLR